LQFVPTEEKLTTGVDQTLIKNEGHAKFAAHLVEAREITVQRVAEAIERLKETHPDHVERLARGPNPSRYSCTVCNAFRAHWDTPGVDDLIDLSEPPWVVWMFHEVPKSFMRRNKDLHYGRFANMIYERCVVIYRLSGYKGMVEEPNA
jgi:hypothetical protein